MKKSSILLHHYCPKFITYEVVTLLEIVVYVPDTPGIFDTPGTRMGQARDVSIKL